MNCPQCNAEITPGKKFCRFCGERIIDDNVSVAELCKECGSPLRKGKAFCAMCGAAVHKDTPNELCPTCGNVIAKGRNFCGKCGTNVLKAKAPDLESEVTSDPIIRPNNEDGTEPKKHGDGGNATVFEHNRPIIVLAGISLAIAVLAFTIISSYKEKASKVAPLPPPAPLSAQANEKESEYSHSYSMGNTNNEDNQPAPSPLPEPSVTQLEDDETSHEAAPESKTEEAASEDSFYAYTNETDIDKLILQLDDRLIDYSELIGYDQSQTAFIRNGVYALSGLIFTKKVYIDYFSPKGWYVPYSEEPSVVVERFNNYQSKNLKTILEYESNMGWR